MQKTDLPDYCGNYRERHQLFCDVYLCGTVTLTSSSRAMSCIACRSGPPYFFFVYESILRYKYGMAEVRYQIHCRQVVAELACVLEPLLKELFEQVCEEIHQNSGTNVLNDLRPGEGYVDVLRRIDMLKAANKLWKQGLKNMCNWQERDLDQEVQQLTRNTDFHALVSRTLSSLAIASGRCSQWQPEWSPTEQQFLKTVICCIADWPAFSHIRYVDTAYDKSQALSAVTERACYRLMDVATHDLPELEQPTPTAMVAKLLDEGRLRLSPLPEQGRVGSATSRRSSRTVKSLNSAQSNHSRRSNMSNTLASPSPQTKTITLSPLPDAVLSTTMLPHSPPGSGASHTRSVPCSTTYIPTNNNDAADLPYDTIPDVRPEDSVSCRDLEECLV